MHTSDDAPPVPLPRRPIGIETFRVQGTLFGEPVHANWDGRWVILSAALCEYVALALAVDDAIAEVATPPHSCSPRPSPEEFMLAVVTACDYIDCAEYDIRGHHRSISSERAALPLLRKD